MIERRPLRDVVGEPLLVTGRGSVLGPDTARRTRWWEVRLTCGHIAERPARYAPLTDERRAAGERATARRADAVRPAPRRARCDYCPKMSDVANG